MRRLPPFLVLSTNEAAVRDHVLGFATSLGLETMWTRPETWLCASPHTQAANLRRLPHCKAISTWFARRTRARISTLTPNDPPRSEGSWLYADGTTLGSDNGVGVAAALAVMESKTIKHGPMEFVFTVEEETTLGGASAFKSGVLKASYLLNLDNEERGTLCIGCAGGLNTRARRKIAFQLA